MIKIFRLNDIEWWVGETLEECVQASMKETGLTREEVVDEDAQEASYEEKYHTEEGDIISFAEQLQNDIENNRKPPYLFASTEF